MKQTHARTYFTDRTKETILPLYKSLVRPHLDGRCYVVCTRQRVLNTVQNLCTCQDSYLWCHLSNVI